MTLSLNDRVQLRKIVRAIINDMFECDLLSENQSKEEIAVLIDELQNKYGLPKGGQQQSDELELTPHQIEIFESATMPFGIHKGK